MVKHGSHPRGTLAWSTTGATTCSIDEGVGNVSCNGSAEVTPQAQTTYTLTATGQGGSRRSNVSVALAPPPLATFSPDEGLPGETLHFSLTGTGFASGQTQVTGEGAGVKVSDLVVTDASTLTFTATLATDATPGDRSVRVTTPARTTSALPFTILPLPVPAVQQVSPTSGTPGSTATVTFPGSGFVAGATNVAVSGEGVSVENMQVGAAPAPMPGRADGAGDPSGTATATLNATATSLQADLVIAQDAPPGAREITVTTPGGTSDPITFTELAPGLSHTCGIATDGSGWCWGSGTLGTGPDTNSQSLTPVPVGGGHEFASITIGNSTSCGIATDGAALCWVSGTSGRLGNGSTNPSPTPTEVFGGHTFTEISGSHNGAFCALTMEGQILCWGSGSNYRLGNGSLDNRTIPTPGGRRTYLHLRHNGRFTRLRADDGRKRLVLGIRQPGTARERGDR